MFDAAPERGPVAPSFACCFRNVPRCFHSGCTVRGQGPLEPPGPARHNGAMLTGRIKRTIRFLRMAADEQPGEGAVVRPHVRRWLRDRWTFADPLDQDRPWVVYEAAEWLNGLLEPEWSVFEWGSGVSTLFFARRVQRVVTIEHVDAWRARVAERLEREGLTNVDLRCVPPDPADERADAEADGAERAYARYAGAIDAEPDRSLDLVMVDGRARALCIEHALPKLRPGGWLVLDNAERAFYASIRARLEQYESKQFRGVANGVARYFETAAWRITG